MEYCCNIKFIDAIITGITIAVVSMLASEWILPIIKRNKEIKHLRHIIIKARDAMCQTITEEREFPNRPFASFVTKFETALEKSVVGQFEFSF